MNNVDKINSKLVSIEQLRTEYGIDLDLQQLVVLERKGLFPKRLRVGERRVQWRRAQIDHWEENLPLADEAPLVGSPAAKAKAAKS